VFCASSIVAHCNVDSIVCFGFGFLWFLHASHVLCFEVN